VIPTLDHVPRSERDVLCTVTVVPLIEMKEANNVPVKEKVLAPHKLDKPAAVLAELGQCVSV